MTGELQVVERALEATRCAYCDQPSFSVCPACSRPNCAAHRSSSGTRFCLQCEAEWSPRARSRSIAGLVVMLVVGAATFFASLLLTPLLGWLSLLGMIGLPVPVAWAANTAVQRAFRRNFRPTGALPAATLRE